MRYVTPKSKKKPAVVDYRATSVWARAITVANSVNEWACVCVITETFITETWVTRKVSAQKGLKEHNITNNAVTAAY